MFNGVYHHQIDAKGRTALPARFRDVLAGQETDKLFITEDLLEGCLQAFAPAQWQAFTDKVSALPQFQASTRLVVRSMIAPAQECPFDKVGRLLLPSSLREHAGLSDAVVWAGSGKRIELWSPKGWKQCNDAARVPEVRAHLAAEVSKLL